MILRHLKKPKAQRINISNINGKGFLELDKWQLSRYIAERLYQVSKNTPFPLDELMMLVGTVAYFKPEVIFEWGTHIGKSARIFYEANLVFNDANLIYSVDLPIGVEHVEHPGEGRGKLVKGIKEVNLLLGDGVEEAMKVYKTIKPKGRVLFFLDGDHEYKSVKRELSTIIKEVKDPVILVHDTFNQVKSSGYNTGPFRAIQKVVGQNKKFEVVSTNFGLPGMSLIYTKK